MPASRPDSAYDYEPMPARGERSYPLFSMSIKLPWVRRLLIALAVAVLAYLSYRWYLIYGSDPAPDSLLGLIYGVAGLVCFVLAGVLYTLKRRARRKAIGQLNAALNWHLLLALTGLVIVFLHSFGNFNPRSGTYALYGMIALAVSGLVGRGLDRLMPRLIAAEASKALTAQGEDRMESISQRLQSLVVHNTQRIRGRSTDPRVEKNPEHTPQLPNVSGQTLHGPWDLAYISLEETPQELERGEPHYRFVPDRQSSWNQPGALMPGTQQEMVAMQEVQRAHQREQFYRYVIRYWRILHIALVLVTTGLLLWHLEYAASLLIPVYFH